MKNLFTVVVLSLCFWGCQTSLQKPFLAETLKENLSPDPLISQVMQGLPQPEPAFPLPDLKMNDTIDYSAYGHFENSGTADYRYAVTDINGLAAAIGEGVYPNTARVLADPVYQRLREQGLLTVDAWEALKLNDWRRAFYIWTQAPLDGGTKLFFTAYSLEQAGHIRAAIQAYHAVLVHFPRQFVWSMERDFVWYVSAAALDNIQRLTRDYPDLNLELEGATFEVKNGYDTKPDDDVIAVNPGRLVKKTLAEKLAALPDLNQLKVVERRGEGKVQLIKFENGHWQMQVAGKPFYVRGISYNPTAVGAGPQSDLYFMPRWMFSDINQNGKNDAAYDAWVDKNRNEIQDEDEKPIGDFELMRQMGVNAIRFYAENRPSDTYDPTLVNKPLLREMFARYGIRVIVGDYLGAYTIGSGASWEIGTDYHDPKQRSLMKEAVRAKVLDFKDEPFVLAWVLGNENNVSADYMGHNATRTNASLYPEDYARFLNEVAAMIHELDGNHPVLVGNADEGLIEYYAAHAPELDMIGINSYRGTVGFGDLFKSVGGKLDRPVLITEYGCDAYAEGKGEDEAAQAQVLEGKFRDIVLNEAGGPGEGNAVGGIIFEYLDEWWKDSFNHPEDVHQTASQFAYEFPDGYSHEEWLGIVSQGDGKHSPFKRQLRAAYEYFKRVGEK